VGKLKRYVTTANEQDSAGQGIEFQKLFASGEVVFTWNVKRLRFRAGGDQKVSGFQYV
jgi:hypothetical protein